MLIFSIPVHQYFKKYMSLHDDREAVVLGAEALSIVFQESVWTGIILGQLTLGLPRSLIASVATPLAGCPELIISTKRSRLPCHSRLCAATRGLRLM